MSEKSDIINTLLDNILRRILLCQDPEEEAAEAAEAEDLEAVTVEAALAADRVAADLAEDRTEVPEDLGGTDRHRAEALASAAFGDPVITAAEAVSADLWECCYSR